MCLRARGWCPHGACVHGDDGATTACARACVLGRPWKGRGLTRRGALLRSRCQPERHRGWLVVLGFSQSCTPSPGRNRGAVHFSAACHTEGEDVLFSPSLGSESPLSPGEGVHEGWRLRDGGRAKRTLLVCGLHQQAASGAAGLWQDLPAEATQACMKFDWRNSQSSSPPRSGFSVRDDARGYTAVTADMRLQISNGMPNFDSVNFCTTRFDRGTEVD